MLAVCLYAYNAAQHTDTGPQSSGMFADYQRSEGQLHSAAAAKWRSGEFKSVKDFHDWLHVGMKTAREKDFRPYGEAWNAFDEKQGGKLDPEAYARECERWQRSFGE